MAVPHGKLFNSQIREDTQEASLPPAARPASVRGDKKKTKKSLGQPHSPAEMLLCAASDV